MLPNQSQSADHDILIRVETNLDAMIREMKTFMLESEVRYQKISERVAILENKDGRDSERFKTIADEIRRSLANSERIRSSEVEIVNLKTEIADMRKKSNIIDAINAVGVVIAGAIGSVFGSR